MGRRRRRGGYLTREYRRAKRAMKPNRIAARFISGGKHQTFTRILTSPLRAKTVASGTGRRKQYQAAQRRLARAEAAQIKRNRVAAAKKHRDDAAYARSVQDAIRRRAPKTPRPARTPIAVDPRTGKPITWAQAMKSLREAQERAERLARGESGDPPAKTPRTGAAKKTTPRRRTTSPRRPATATAKKPVARKPRKPGKKPAPPPDPTAAPGKSLHGLVMAATCPCQGTGRIAVYQGQIVVGSVSCDKHGRTARGGRKFTSRRAVTDSGLPGLASWLAAKTRRGRGNLDKKQARAHDRATSRPRHAGPTVECGGCDAGIVNKQLTEDLRARMVADLGAGEDPPSLRKRRAAARKAYPYDLHRDCGGLGRVPDMHAGSWLERTPLRDRHRLTAREAATGKRQKT